MQETAHSLRHAVDLTFDLSKLRTPVATDWQGPYSVPESRAERLFRAAHIALSLAVQEKMDSPTEAILPLLFRGLDQVTPSVYKVTSDSSGTGGAAKQREDFQALLRELWEASCMSQGLVGELVCDAHNLAELFSLREQEALGNNLASSRITSIRNGLKLRSAKELAVEAVSISPNRYWKETQANQHLADYLYEIGQLRVTQRSGWLNLKIAPESVSEHSLRAAQMAYLVARISESDDTNGVTPCALAAHLLVHDNTENRTGDPNAVSKRYVEVNEPLVLSHQIAKIGDVGTLVNKMHRAVSVEQKTALGLLAKDIDRLEMVVTAIELERAGIRDLDGWITGTKPSIKTEIGKQVMQYIEERSGKSRKP